MPTLHLEMHPGRTAEQKRQFVAAVTHATCDTLACPPDTVEIIITEIGREHWASGGKLRCEPSAS